MSGFNITQRPRRLRHSASIRSLVQETTLEVRSLIQPFFIVEGTNQRIPIKTMPGIFRLSPDQLLVEARECWNLGIKAIALFPALPDSRKDKKATESLNTEGLYLHTIRALKKELPELLIISDVAMDPYSSDGHDGLVENGKILNDPTLEILSAMAVAQAKAGADIVAPSDMMDGRVGAIRKALDNHNFSEVSILSYTAKYASCFYGPFRDALDSTPRFGDKKTYQMNPANSSEALRELRLDIEEGADIVMVKPALNYLDIIYRIKQATDLPVAAYAVSGEYAMIKTGAEKGFFDEKTMVLETHLAMKRAGAGIILSYYSKDIAQWMNKK